MSDIKEMIQKQNQDSCTVKENILHCMNHMKEILLIINLKGTGFKFLKAVPNKRVISKIINLKDRENKFNQTGIFKRVSSKMVYSTGEEF